MELVTRKSECKRHIEDNVLIKSPREINRKTSTPASPKYCIIVKPFHASFMPYKQIIFRGVTFSDDFSIELIRNNDPVVITKSSFGDGTAMANLFHNNSQAVFRIMQ